MRGFIVPAAVAALLLGCTPGQTERRNGGEGDGSAETGMTGDPAGGLSTQDTASSGTAMGDSAAGLNGVLSQLEAANTAEIQLSELGVKQAESPAVKDLSQRLVTEHTSNRKQLEALARQKGVDIIGRAGGSTARDTSGVLALEGMTGTAFDSAFVAAQIEAHQTNLQSIADQMLPAVQDPEVRQYLQKTQAAMEKHLASLQQLRGQLRS